MPLMSYRQYAAHRKSLGLIGGTQAGVSKAVAAGRIQLVDGKIDSGAADIAWSQNTRKAVGGIKPKKATTAMPRADAIESEIISMAEAQLRNETAKAELGEMNVKKRRGELLEAVQVNAWETGMIARTKSILLAIPEEMADRLAYESDPNRVRQILRNEIDRALNELSSFKMAA